MFHEFGPSMFRFALHGIILTSSMQWWADVISPGLKQLATSGENQLTIGMLVCGSVLANDAPRRDLLAAVKECVLCGYSGCKATANVPLPRLSATHTFAFATERLQPVLTAQFFQAFALRHLLEGATISGPVMAALLEQSVSLARHSAVWHVFRPLGSEELAIREYKWTHPTIRPHGEDIGLQCPACGSLSCRQGKMHHDQSVTVRCKKKDCQWKRNYPAPAGAQPLNAVEGVWTVRTISLPPIEQPVITL